MSIILLDNNVPRRLRSLLQGHSVETAFERQWANLSNGDLIAAVEAAGFDMLITADKNLRYQQNIAGRALAIIVIPDNRWDVVKANAPEILANVVSARQGTFTEVGFRPLRPPIAT